MSGAKESGRRVFEPEGAPDGAVDRAAAWVYRGVWGALVQYLRVPDRPPSLPAAGPGAVVRSFQPSLGFLRYLKFWFWLFFAIMDVVILGLWALIMVNSRLWGFITLGPALFLAFAPDIVAYIAIHVRYDTTWYVMTDRSLRIRRGVWTINETTATFENVQNIRVEQGPLERYFGIGRVVVETAAAGSAGPHGGSTGSQAVIEGISNAPAIRDQIMLRVAQSKSAGLGDEDLRADRASTGAGWTTAHVEALRAIRDEIRAMPA